MVIWSRRTNQVSSEVPVRKKQNKQSYSYETVNYWRFALFDVLTTQEMKMFTPDWSVVGMTSLTIRQKTLGLNETKKQKFKAKLISLGHNMAHLWLYLAVINCYFFNYLQYQFTCVVLPQPVSPLTSVTWFCDIVVIISCLMLSTGSIFCRICDCTRRGGIWGNPLFSLPVVILLTSVISIWIYT